MNQCHPVDGYHPALEGKKNNKKKIKKIIIVLYVTFLFFYNII